MILALLVLSLSPDEVRDAGSEARAALASGAFPWYDAPRDVAKPLTPATIPDRPPPPAREGWEGAEVGGTDIVQLLVFLVMAAALIALISYLVWTWNRSLVSAEPPKPARGPGKATRVADLPAGLAIDTDDPWAEARRRRDSGDLAGSVVCLFLHLILTLDAKGLVRLGPGMTGRQIVRGIVRDEIRQDVEPTLRLFELAYYGHREPDPVTFQAAWDQAEALCRRLAGEVGR